MTRCIHAHTHCGDSPSTKDEPTAYPTSTGDKGSPKHPYLKEAWCHRTCCHCIIRGHGTHPRAGSRCCALQERDTKDGTRATAGGQLSCGQSGSEKGEAEGGTSEATSPDFCGSSSWQVGYVLVAGWPPPLLTHTPNLYSQSLPQGPLPSISCTVDAHQRLQEGRAELWIGSQPPNILGRSRARLDRLGVGVGVLTGHFRCLLLFWLPQSRKQELRADLNMRKGPFLQTLLSLSSQVENVPLVLCWLAQEYLGFWGLLA